MCLEKTPQIKHGCFFFWLVMEYFGSVMKVDCRSQWPRGLRRMSAAARLLRLWGAWMSVVSAVLSGRGLCDELITCPEKSCRLRCVVVCDLETS